MRFLILLTCLSTTLHADIKTCSEANALKSGNWIVDWTKHSDHQFLRKQAEAAAIVLKLARPNWAQIPSIQTINNMSDRELNDLGENIEMQYLGDADILVRFGFKGGKYFEVIFGRDSNKLSTRVYYQDGLCFIMNDFATQYTGHLPGPGYYSEW